MRRGRIAAALVAFPGFVPLPNSLVSSRQHPIGVAFIVGVFKIASQRLDQRFVLPGLFILFSEPEEYVTVAGVGLEYLPEEVDSGCSHG